LEYDTLQQYIGYTTKSILISALYFTYNKGKLMNRCIYIKGRCAVIRIYKSQNHEPAILFTNLLNVDPLLGSWVQGTLPAKFLHRQAYNIISATTATRRKAYHPQYMRRYDTTSDVNLQDAVRLT
jgi:hypothetical protein